MAQDTFIEPTVAEEGRAFMNVLMDAQISQSLGGLGGCPVFDISEYPERFRDLITMYLDDVDCYSTDVLYIAMDRVAEGIRDFG